MLQSRARLVMVGVGACSCGLTTSLRATWQSYTTSAKQIDVMFLLSTFKWIATIPKLHSSIRNSLIFFFNSNVQVEAAKIEKDSSLFHW